ncbi:hypothetical protein ACFLS9_04390, partial [Bacteroidota bacterium]
VDPTEVENPAITEDKLFEDATGGADPLITGLEFAFSDAVNRTAIFTEVVSDNYVNTSTFISTQLDKPRNITPNDQYLGDDREIYFKLQTLHSLAEFGLNTVLPADAEATDFDKAQTLFYKGIAIVILCENFLAFPLESGGQMIRAEDAIKDAIETLNEAYQFHSSGDHAINTKLALARAYRLDKDKLNSVIAANDALALSGDYIFYAQYDPINLLNRMTIFTVLRSQQDLQPLPRLDFLDPKFASYDGSDPIPVLKTEEAYLILAEAALSDGDIQGAKSYLQETIVLAANRLVVPFLDNDSRNGRPNNSALKVKADSEAQEISGLIYERSGSLVDTHPVSAISLNIDDIDALSSSEDLYQALFLIRQEIFFSEGRRMSDLGIRLPVMERQIDTNPNVSNGDYGTVVFVPDYIPPEDELDEFSLDENTGVVTINYDMNKILAENKNQTSPF